MMSWRKPLPVSTRKKTRMPSFCPHMLSSPERTALHCTLRSLKVKNIASLLPVTAGVRRRLRAHLGETPPQGISLTGRSAALAPGQPLTHYPTPSCAACPGRALLRHAWRRAAFVGPRGGLGETRAEAQHYMECTTEDCSHEDHNPSMSSNLALSFPHRVRYIEGT